MGAANQIRFKCRYCSKRLGAAIGAAGQRVRCPGCTALMVVPKPPTDDEEAAATPGAATTDARRRWPWLVGGAGVLLVLAVGLAVCIWLIVGGRQPRAPARGTDMVAAPSGPLDPTGPQKERITSVAPTPETPKKDIPKPATAPPTELDDWPSKPKFVPIPDGFKAISFSRRGGHVAFVIPEGKRFRAVIDGRQEQSYDQVSIIVFAPSGRHYYYGAYRDKQWHLVRDGKEVVELGRLTSITQGTGLVLIGEPATFTIWRPLIGAFAENADNYMVIGYGPQGGRLFKDGDWLPVSFRSFTLRGMAFSPDGKHYGFDVELPDAAKPTLYIDGTNAGHGEIDDLGYRAASGRFIYRQRRDRTSWTLMEDQAPVPGFPPLPDSHWRGSYALSLGGHHIAALVKKGDQEAVVIDGMEEPPFPTVDWAIEGDVGGYAGSLTWSNDGNSHAYAVYDKKLTSFTTFGEVKDFPSEVVLNGKPLGKQGPVRGSSVALSDDGKHLAYAVKQDDGWLVVVDGVKGPKYHEVGNPVFRKDGRPVYAAKTDRGWELRGAQEAGPFEQVSGLIVGRGGARVAFAAKSADGKWQVFRDGKAVSEPFDGIVAQPGLRFDRAGSLRFVGKAGHALKWVTVAD